MPLRVLLRPACQPTILFVCPVRAKMPCGSARCASAPCLRLLNPCLRCLPCPQGGGEEERRGGGRAVRTSLATLGCDGTRKVLRYPVMVASYRASNNQPEALTTGDKAQPVKLDRLVALTLCRPNTTETKPSILWHFPKKMAKSCEVFTFNQDSFIWGYMG